MDKTVVYAGRDLESMSFAMNYHEWILDEFRPFLGKHFVEVGAGTGSFSELLLQENPQTLSLIEPSEMFGQLQNNILQLKSESAVKLYQSVFTKAAAEIAARQKPDSIVYVNVLEHIEDDLTELKTIYQTLEKGGRCFIFVPALMGLYGEFDRKIGHFRRYTKSELKNKCKLAGFNIIKSKYFDFAGIIPWYAKYKILKSDSLNAGAVTLYDKIVVPVTSRLEKIIPVPIGKNLLLIAEKNEN
ncbi:MAG: methyltransferase domain-containing protein [Pyrinomonadaceae bacterium]